MIRGYGNNNDISTNNTHTTNANANINNIHNGNLSNKKKK